MSWFYRKICGIYFYILGLFNPGLLSKRADKEVKVLKQNLVYKKLEYSYIRKIFDYIVCNASVFIILFMSIFVALVFISDGLVRSDVMSVSKSTDLLSYLISTQGGMFFALLAFFPIAVLLQGSTFKDDNIREEVINLMIRETRIFELITSASLLLIYLFFIEYMNHLELITSFNMILASIGFIWLTINVLGVVYLIYRGLWLINPYRRNDTLIKFIANVIYPRELAKHLKKNILFALNSGVDGSSVDVLDGSISISVGFGTFSEIKPQCVKYLKCDSILSDIDINKIQFVIERWQKRCMSDKTAKQHPKYIFSIPAMVNNMYQEKQTLCGVIGGVELTDLEKEIIKSAFIFKPCSGYADNSSILNKYMKLFEETSLDAIKRKDLDGFRTQLNQHIKFYLDLTSLGEFSGEEGKSLNFTKIVSLNLFSDINQDWMDTYNNIFKAAIRVLPEDDGFFRVCCHVGNILVRGLIKNTSFTGVIDAIKVQAYLWYHLNDLLVTYPDKTHFDTIIKKFLEGWESLLSLLVSSFKKDLTWNRSKEIFAALREHLDHTLSFLGYSVFTENEAAVCLWVDASLNWHNQAANHNFDEMLYYQPENKQTLITASIYDDKLEDFAEYIGIDSSEKKLVEFIFANALRNYWADSGYVLMVILLKWCLKNPEKQKFYINALLKILQAKGYDDSSNNQLKPFIASPNDYFSSFIRRRLFGSYSQHFKNISYTLESLINTKRLYGRIYTTVSGNDEVNYDVIMSVILFITSQNKIAFRDDLQTFPKGCKLLSDAIYEIDCYIKAIDEIDTRNYVELFNKILNRNKPKVPVNVALLDGSEPVNMDVEDTNDIKYVLNEMKSVLLKLKSNFKKHEDSQISILEIDDLKLIDLADKISSKRFSCDDLEFPVGMFSSVNMVDKTLSEFSMRLENFPRGVITNPKTNDYGYTDNYFEDTVCQNVYSRLIVDILNEAKSDKILHEIVIEDESAYIKTLNEITSEYSKKNLHPILIVERGANPPWVPKWLSYKWKDNDDSVKGLKVEFNPDEKSRRYLCHVNGIPVYQSLVRTHGSIVLPREGLASLEFQQMSNGYQILVTYEQSDIKPAEGVLLFKWGRKLILNEHPIYMLKYPEK